MERSLAASAQASTLRIMMRRSPKPGSRHLRASGIPSRQGAMATDPATLPRVAGAPKEIACRDILARVWKNARNGDPTMNTAVERRNSPLTTSSDLGTNAVRDISGALTVLLADVFALYIKTKNFHWHVSGKHFRDYHLMLDERGDELFPMSDVIAQRACNIGGPAFHSLDAR